MDHIGSAKSYNIYTPPVNRPASKQALTPAVLQSQVQKMTRLFQEAPQTKKAAPVERVEGRKGEVLHPDSFLKADHFPGLHNEALQEGLTKDPQPRIEGAPNYREVGDRVHGTGQPTVDGMREVLERADAGPEGEGKAVWTNLREEPVIYINGSPFNLRHVKAPFNNQSTPGRSAAEVEAMERQLKDEVLQEAERNGGYITLHQEEAGNPPKVVEKKVKIESLQTPDEVFKQLKEEGYRVDYQRIPVTDMKKPEDRDIDELVDGLKKADPDAELIFNCHAGRGRTTTAMVLASLMRRAEQGKSGDVLRDQNLREDIKEQGQHDPSNYRQLLHTVKGSQELVENRKQVDEVVKEFDHVHDLKKAAERADDPRKAADYLERYHTLVSFDAYAQEQAPDFHLSYSEWKEKNPGLEQGLGSARGVFR